MIRPFVLAVVTLSLLTGSALAQDLPRVYLAAKAPEASGFVDAGAKERRDVLKELTNQLRGKKKALVLVESAEQADVLLELTDANIGTGSRQTSRVNRLSGAIETSKDKAYLAAVTLKAGEYTTEFTGEGVYPVTVARQLAKAIETWITENRAQLAKTRP